MLTGNASVAKFVSAACTCKSEHWLYLVSGSHFGVSPGECLGSTKDLCSIGRVLLENVSVFRHVKVVSGYMSLALSTFFVSSTGNFNIIYWDHMKKMKTPDTLTTRSTWLTWRVDTFVFELTIPFSVMPVILGSNLLWCQVSRSLRRISLHQKHSFSDSLTLQSPIQSSL